MQLCHMHAVNSLSQRPVRLHTVPPPDRFQMQVSNARSQQPQSAARTALNTRTAFTTCRQLTDKFVHHIRLRCVHGLAGVPHVLCGVEVLEGQARQEVTRVHQTSNRANLTASNNNNNSASSSSSGREIPWQL